MQIGEVIREYRRKQQMTQEEMGKRLGVTTPAVNKWEKGNSKPDIELLAPIARLLGISLDTLLSFQTELTEIEIGEIIEKLDEKLENEDYDSVFEWAEQRIREYPNCNQLIWQIAVVLDTRRLMDGIVDTEKYEEQINGWYETVLKDKKEEIRKHAADSLFGSYLRKGQYDKAEEYLAYFSYHDPQGKLNQARLCQAKGDRQGAYKMYEQMLLSGYQTINAVFSLLYMLAMEAGEKEKAKFYLEKQGNFAHLFEMGKYAEVSGMLDFLCYEKNVDGTLHVVEKLLESVDTIGDFRKSALYEHLEFSELKEEFFLNLKEKLFDGFKERESFGFMNGNPDWEKLIQKEE